MESLECDINLCALKLGYSSLKAEQMEVVKEFIKGRDVFAVLPTGFGKTLCFAMLPLLFDMKRGTDSSIVVVVTPLISIMQSMVEEYQKRGITSGCIHKEITDDEMKDRVRAGKYKLVFFTPEALLNTAWRSVLLSSPYQTHLVGFIVDEAHTVQKWGDTFRKSLKQVGDVRSLLPADVHIMALTATATCSVRKVVLRRLCMHSPHLVAVPPCRSNIMYTVCRFASFSEAFLPYVNDLVVNNVAANRTIIYCNTFKQCCDIRDYFYSELKQNRFYPVNAPIDISKYRLVDVFTSLTDPLVKETIINSFVSPNSILRLVIATSAFGMGVNCKSIRTVINFGAPEEVEDYIQQTGRVGRDGLPSKAILLWSPEMIRYSSDIMKQYCKLSDECRRDFLFADYDNYAKDSSLKKDQCCDICALKVN